MATIYVGPASAGAADGTSWANRYGSLNAAEDRPVQAGDTVYVGPGTYREVLTVDVSGSSGSPITYIGDYTGANTDGVGGVVRITASDNDQTAARTSCVTDTGAHNYRTFCGFALDSSSAAAFLITSAGTHWIIEQCNISSAGYAVSVAGASQSAWTIKNCFAVYTDFVTSGGVFFSHSANVDNTGHVIENCIINGRRTIRTDKVGGITVRNCMVMAQLRAIEIGSALAAGQTLTVNNCIVVMTTNPFYAVAADGSFVEDYNSLYLCGARTNVTTGAHSNTYIYLPDTRWFFEAVNGGTLVSPYDLASYSQLLNVAGTSPTTADLRGTTVQGAQREWGALEYDSTLDVEAGSSGGVYRPIMRTLGG